MKTAKYKYQTTNSMGETHTLYCQVTLKNDGKLSFNIENGLSNIKFRAKSLGKEIVNANFDHPSVIEFIGDNVGLVKQLTEKTQDLKEIYIERCKEWEQKNFIRLTNWMNNLSNFLFDEHGFYSKDFYNFFGIKIEHKTKFGRTGWYICEGRDNKKIYDSALSSIKLTKDYLSKDVKYHIDKAEIKAISHYNDSISKLSRRLNDKGITNDSNFIIETSNIGVNFECIIRSGDIIVRAWTIIAEGEIQRPHYRYLVK